MNLVYISPHFPDHYIQFSESLARYDVNILGISDQPDECLPERLKAVLAGHYRVDSFFNTDQVLAACRFFQEKWGRIDRVESHLEPWLELESICRAEFDVPGFKPDDLQFIKKKSLMKSIFSKAEVPTAKGLVISSFDETKRFISGEYPVFIKPDIGVGASDTYTIHNEEELRGFFRIKKDYAYFLEGYLAGAIESFDGLTDREGKIVLSMSQVFNHDIHKVVTENLNLCYYPVRAIPDDIRKYGERVVKAAGIKEKFFHIEFFRLADGSLKGLELNVRPPGGLSTHMFNYSCDIDVYDWWARIVARGDSEQPFERKYHCAHVGRKYDRSYKYSDREIRERLGANLVHDREMNPFEYVVMGNRAFLVRSPDLKHLQEMIELIHQEA